MARGHRYIRFNSVPLRLLAYPHSALFSELFFGLRRSALRFGLRHLDFCASYRLLNSHSCLRSHRISPEGTERNQANPELESRRKKEKPPHTRRTIKEPAPNPPVPPIVNLLSSQSNGRNIRAIQPVNTDRTHPVLTSLSLSVG